MSLGAGGRHGFRTLLDEALGSIAGEAAELLAPLDDYDHRHAGDLVHTLFIYLAAGCNATRAAERLYLHRSSLLYRLRRIEQILGVSLADYQARVALELATLARIGVPGETED